jgi:hypothetical protein
VRYIISPQHVFSTEQADEQRADLERLSSFFSVALFPITYYSCADPTDLFRLKGYQYHPMMHVFPSGGRVDDGGNVFSGNDKDIYTHEMVHLKYPNHSADFWNELDKKMPDYREHENWLKQNGVKMSL